MLTAAIFLPFLAGILVLCVPATRPAFARALALAGALATLGLVVALWIGYDADASGLAWRTTREWIPAIGARYDVALDGVSLPLVALTALLLVLSLLYTLGVRERPRLHGLLFLLMATGLIGVFSARDLLLFYVFFEIALVPMYFVIGIWGGENRRYAAMKFFLYTRLGSLAMLLAFLALYLAMQPHTFSLPAIAAAHPLAGRGFAGGLVLLGMLLGFGVKLPMVPLHNWLPDAHVEAPTEGSVMLAGVQLKMGAYGLIAVMLPTVPEAARAAGTILLGLGILTLLYGALAALAQNDLKRLVAYTSVNHMGYVLIGVAVAALAADRGVRELALDGAALQAVSHGLLTGGMFFLVGMIGHRAGSRDLARLAGIARSMPALAVLWGLFSFASLGLPGFSGFVAEFQVIGGAVSLSAWPAALTVLGLALATGLYLMVLARLVFSEPAPASQAYQRPSAAELACVVPLIVASLGIGVFPGPLVALIASAASAIPLIAR